MSAILSGIALQVQVTTLCHSESAGGLPYFSQDYLIWLLQPTLDFVCEAPLIGMAISVKNSLPDVLTLSHEGRIVMLKLPESVEQQICDPCGLDLLKDILVCSSSFECVDPFQGTQYTGRRLQLVCLTASESALLLYNALQVHSCLMDLDLLASKLRFRLESAFTNVHLIEEVLGEKAGGAVLSLGPDQLMIIIGSEIQHRMSFRRFHKTIQFAIGSYLVGVSLAKDIQDREDEMQLLEESKIDTRRITPRLVGHISQFEAVENALHMAKPKEGQSHLRKNNAGKGKHNSVAYEELPSGKGKDRFKNKSDMMMVTNEQYKTKLVANSRQFLDIRLKDGSGQTHSCTGKTIRSEPGKKSTLAFKGKQGKAAMEMLRKGTGAFIESIDFRGREDHSNSELAGMLWRRQMMCCKEEGGKFWSEDCDSSQLLTPFLLGDEHPPPVEGLVESRTIRLMKRPARHKYNMIVVREMSEKLNPSQAKAARAILSPLIRSHPLDNPTSSSQDEWTQQDRFVLVHGPPGTGKTSLITACCEQWQYSCSNIEGKGEYARDAIYACCQSNVAVKNIAESFMKAGIKFKIIVSADFFVEWHEDLYNDIKSHFLRSDKLPNSKASLIKALDNCDVILCTLAFLSSPKNAKSDSPLLKIRPMRLLFVDEASQIHLRAYPHLLQRFGSSLARIIFLGDHCQLPPFQGDTVPYADQSVFELDHLRRKAFLLNVCYRLPTPLAKFISVNVYEGLLLCGSMNYNPEGGLLSCVSFIDVADSVEGKVDKSRANQKEVEMVIRLIKEYRKRGGVLSNLKVLTTYNAQRDALEKALQKTGFSGDSDVVFTVDSFQGRECDYIILSLVKDGKGIYEQVDHKSDKKQKQEECKPFVPALGFLNDDRRINVALTRAKKGVVVVSNRRFINLASETLLGKLHRKMENLGSKEKYWWDQLDILNNRMPTALFGLLPEGYKWAVDL